MYETEINILDLQEGEEIARYEHDAEGTAWFMTFGQDAGDNE